MQETTYKGYRIRYHKVAEWFAHVYRPGSPNAIGEIPKATLKEGEAVLMKRIHDLIDREEAKKASKAEDGKKE